MAKHRVIVTAGPTREYLDPVRFISNPSSGKMGIALADAAYEREYATTLIHGPISSDLIVNREYPCLSVSTTEEMLQTVIEELEDFSILIMAAAPADYTPVRTSETKMKKGEGELTVSFKRTPDILASVYKLRKQGKCRNCFIAGFAAETDNWEKNAHFKLEKKGLDLICLNNILQKGAGFGSETNEMVLMGSQGDRIDLPMKPKEAIASDILDYIINRIKS